MPEEGPLFRQEAIDRLHRPERQEGAVLALSPRWVASAWRLLLAAALASAGFVSLARVGEYATGPAVVRLEGRITVSAPEAGTVARVDALPGARVEAGAPLVHLHDAGESADLAAAERAFELALVDLLLDPGDAAARARLAALRAERDRAAADVAMRVLVAPAAGAVGDTYVQPGQRLSPGDPVASLAVADARPAVTALLPGQHRPRLTPGMTLYLELAGYADTRARARVVSVSQDIVGPGQAGQVLGAALADAVPLSGPMVVVRAELTEASFLSDGRELLYYHGMTGVAEVRVRSRSLLLTLVPGLDRLWGRLHAD